MWDNVTFENPEFFWLLLVIPIAVVWYIWKRNRQTAEILLPGLQGFGGVTSLRARMRPLLLVLRMLVLGLIITAMARPRSVDVTTSVSSTSGIDIVMAIDVSASMLARDFTPNRLEATKEVASEFIQGRLTDRFGLVVYAGESFTQTPITSDKNIVLGALDAIEYSNILEGGTAIGMGLATSVNRLKDSRAESKVIILLTDGVNNAGFIDPKIASELAAQYDIKTYTIGVGSNGMALSPVAILPNGQFQYRNVPVEIDEELLQQIAQATGGRYFRATDNTKLEEIYEEIDQLETTEIEETRFYNYQEHYRPLVLLAGVLLILEMLLRFTVFRNVV